MRHECITKSFEIPYNSRKNAQLNMHFQVAKRGEILKVKVLGTVALIDEGNMFFKLYKYSECL